MRQQEWGGGGWRVDPRPPPPVKKSMRVFPPYRGLFLHVEGLVSTFEDLFFFFWGLFSPLASSNTNADKINEMKRC